MTSLQLSPIEKMISHSVMSPQWEVVFKKYRLYIKLYDAAVPYIAYHLFKNRKDIATLSGLDVQLFESGITETSFTDIDKLEIFMFVETIELFLIPFSIKKQEGDTFSGHKNLLVIDRAKKQFEFYDPNGALGHILDYQHRIWKNIVHYFTVKMPGQFDGYRILTVEKSCPIQNFQFYESFRSRDPKYIEGFCVVWTMFLLHLRIKYHQHDPMLVQQHFIDELHFKSRQETQNENPSEEELAAQFHKFMKNYTSYIFKETLTKGKRLSKKTIDVLLKRHTRK